MSVKYKNIIRRGFFTVFVVGCASQITPAENCLTTVASAIWLSLTLSSAIGYTCYFVGWENGHYSGWQKARGYEMPNNDSTRVGG